MVGYAYSVDSDSDYNYISVKSYDCDDLLFADETTPCQIYRLSRKDCSVELVHPKGGGGLRHLSLKNITEIAQMLFCEEYNSDHPVRLSWSINSSGVCEKKSAEDLFSCWPLTPYHIEKDAGYINITKVFFSKPPLYLKSSFAAEVLNEATYCCGVYAGDIVTAIGDELFCSFELAYLIRSLFGNDDLFKISLKFAKQKDIKIKKLKRRNILAKIKKTSINLDYAIDFPARNLCIIKAECINKVINAIFLSLKQGYPLAKLVEEINTAFNTAFDKLDMQKDEFVYHSGGKSASDMSYLTFNELMMIFTFGEYKKEASEKIKANHNRKHHLKELEVPKVIYKGKLY